LCGPSATPALLAATSNAGPVLIHSRPPTLQPRRRPRDSAPASSLLWRATCSPRAVEASPSSPALNFNSSSTAAPDVVAAGRVSRMTSTPCSAVPGDSTRCSSIAGDSARDRRKPFQPGRSARPGSSKRTGSSLELPGGFHLTSRNQGLLPGVGQAVLLYERGMVLPSACPMIRSSEACRIWNDTAGGMEEGEVPSFLPVPPPYHDLRWGALLASSGTDASLPRARRGCGYFVQRVRTPIDCEPPCRLLENHPRGDRRRAGDRDRRRDVARSSSRPTTPADARPRLRPLLVYEARRVDLDADGEPYGGRRGSAEPRQLDRRWRGDLHLGFGAESHTRVAGASGALYFVPAQRNDLGPDREARVRPRPRCRASSLLSGRRSTSTARRAPSARRESAAIPGTVQVVDVQARQPCRRPTAPPSSTSQGCLPQMFASGVPRMTNSRTVPAARETNVLNNKTAHALHTRTAATDGAFRSWAGTLLPVRPRSPRTAARRSPTGGHPTAGGLRRRRPSNFRTFKRLLHQSGSESRPPPRCAGVGAVLSNRRTRPTPFQAGLSDPVEFHDRDREAALDR
jgi:hypothetical protein